MKLAGVMWAFTHTDTLGFSYVQLCKLCHKESVWSFKQPQWGAQ